MIYRSLLRPLLFRLPPESVHEWVLHALPFATGTRTIRNLIAKRNRRSPFGELKRFGLTFSNPVGLAAGFDKNGTALEALAALGFGHLEAGTVTNQQQPGNPKPRLFRLPEDQALINRAGFNNDGAEAFVARVSKRRPDCILGVSIGKSKAAPLTAAVTDYLKSFATVFPVADYVAVNVSSPNTPGLRNLQQANELEALLTALQQKNDELVQAHTKLLTPNRSAGQPVPLLVKLAPDLSLEELERIVEVVGRTNIAGLIATNTTIERNGLRSSRQVVEAAGAGGLSGAPLRHRSTEMIATLYRLTGGALPLIGVGGIFTAADAWEKICAGASLIQLYTGFIYQGPTVAREINEGLAEILRQEGFAHFDDAIGSQVAA